MTTDEKLYANTLKRIMREQGVSLLGAHQQLISTIGNAVDAVREELTGMKNCPRCNEQKLRVVEVQNALSRRDNSTYICSDCGNEEAMIDAGLCEITDNEFNFGIKIAGGVK